MKTVVKMAVKIIVQNNVQEIVLPIARCHVLTIVQDGAKKPV